MASSTLFLEGKIGINFTITSERLKNQSCNQITETENIKEMQLQGEAEYK